MIQNRSRVMLEPKAMTQSCRGHGYVGQRGRRHGPAAVLG